MIDITTLRAMAKAGASVDVILAAVEAELQAEGERVQARRARDARRQKRHRKSRDVTVTPRDRCDIEKDQQNQSHINDLSANGSDSSLTFLLSKKEESKKEATDVKKKKVRAAKCHLPDDWLPKPSHYAKGSKSFVERKADDMRYWAKAKGVFRADWDATFHQFLRPRETKDDGNNNPLAGIM